MTKRSTPELGMGLHSDRNAHASVLREKIVIENNGVHPPPLPFRLPLFSLTRDRAADFFVKEKCDVPTLAPLKR